MGLNDTPSANRVHIGFFGRRNAGKSSVVNAVTGQELAVVSDTKGTTTDPVYKSMELLPIGPVMIIDTPGFDDEGELGAVSYTHLDVYKRQVQRWYLRRLPQYMLGIVQRRQERQWFT